MSNKYFEIEDEGKMDKDFAFQALYNNYLWNSISRHRARFSSIQGVDYTKDLRKEIKLTPPDDVMKLWENDYKYMQEHMIYDGTALSFANLLGRMRELENRFHENK